MIADENAIIDENRFDPIKIFENEKNENIICDVCLDDDDEEGNEILICENCLVAVH